MSQFDVTVVDYPRKRLAGLKVRTSMKKAHIDCPAIWQTFGPRIGELSPEGCPGSYGVSVMVNAEDFDYWATIELDPAKAASAGLETIETPAGPYAKVAVPHLEKMGEAYMFIYEDWLKSQTAYAYKADGPCFELYPPDWKPEAAFEIFMPLVKV